MGIKSSQFKSILNVILNLSYLKFTFSRVLLLFRKGGIGDYTSLGDDVIPGLDGKFKDSSKSLWFNLSFLM